LTDLAERDRIAMLLLERLPDGWRVGRPSCDPSVHRWCITARGPHPGRGRAPDTETGQAIDEIGAMVDLAQRLDERRRDAKVEAIEQTITYALLLARLSGSATAQTSDAASHLDPGHSLLAQVLRILADPQARQELALGISLLERSIGAVDVKALGKHGTEPWLYFYEDFLDVYDHKLRKDRGVYYTPIQVVQAQVRLVSHLLQDRLSRSLSFADEDVVLLDPAVGTGTYPLAAIKHGLDVTSARFGPGATGDAASRLAANTYAFELLVGPYAVAHLRVSQEILDAGGTLPPDGIHVYLADTLESPFAAPPGQMTLMHRKLSEEHQRAQAVKANVRVLVCIGNPPYDRQQRDDPEESRKGGWVRFGDHGTGGILADFTKPASDAGAGRHLKNIFNDYVYFWRWALWKVFETADGPGVLSFITASSYLRGPGFLGVRQRMREAFDEFWIIDLEGSATGPRKTENVFAIRSPVAIMIGIRYGPPSADTPGVGHYAKLEGPRAKKLADLDALTDFGSLSWRTVQGGWTDPLLPEGVGNFFSWPLLTDTFPWQAAGTKVGRTWPIAPTKEVLEARWDVLRRSPTSRRQALFKDSPTGRKYDWAAQSQPLIRIRDMAASEEPEGYAQYGFRSLDRQWLIADQRVLDRSSPDLWAVHSERQVYMTSLLTSVLGPGPVTMATAFVPDLHHFRGSFGGKDVVPLYRDKDARHANVSDAAIAALASAHAKPPTAEDVFAYAYAILNNPSYADTYADELELSAPRIPFTTSAELFHEVSRLGRELLRLHTFGQRFRSTPQGGVQSGRAQLLTPISGPGGWPDRSDYDPASEELTIGSGSVRPVSPDVMEYSISGYPVVAGWLADRVGEGYGRESSELDKVRPAAWTLELSRELLELIWVIEQSVDLRQAMDDAFGKVIAGTVLSADDVGSPTSDRRSALRPAPAGPQASLGLSD
jgi:hypothetical protein